MRRLVCLAFLAVTVALAPSVRGQTTVWGWGGASLGDGTSAGGTVPIQLPLTDYVQLAAGAYHSHGRKQDGTVWSWGSNSDGVLGNGTYGADQALTPVQVVGLTGAVDVAAGAGHVLAVKDDGTVWAWGSNDFGQLGNGTANTSNVPVQVIGMTGVAKVSAGYRHSLALKSDGTVWAWGWNDSGLLGNGSTTNSTTPVQVSGLSGVVAISAGASHSLALKSDGTVWAWGQNYKGELHAPVSGYSTIPVQTTDINGVTRVAAGYYFSVALKGDGTVWAWGDNAHGQLADGTKNPNSTMHEVPVSNATSIAAGSYHAFAVKSNGTVWGWGWNNERYLGYGTNSAFDIPFPVMAKGLTGVTAVTAGRTHNYVMRAPAVNWSAPAIMQNQTDWSVALLTLSGSRFTDSKSTAPKVNTNLAVVASADFNADGNDDLVVQYTASGQVAILFMNGTFIQSTTFLDPNPYGPNWVIEAAADYDLDGKPELVGRDTVTQQVSFFGIEGHRYVSSTPLTKALAPGWKVVGAADFFGNDGRADLVVQNTTTRQLSILTLPNPYSADIDQSVSLFPTLPANWLVSAVTDCDGDGKPDLLVQNSSTGQIAVLTIVNMRITSSYSVSPNPLAGWTLVGPR